jgi:molybdopterin synthase catalytic subunit
MITITEEPIDVSNMLLSSKDPSAGATVLFIGSIRDHNDTGKVSEVRYEVYQKMAERTLSEIEDRVLKRWDVKKFLAIHRIGNLKVNEISVAIAISTEHRQDAFEACRYTIDSIKSGVPIWKKEISDAGAIWIDGTLPSIEEGY